ncbi:MAG: transporter permease [Deltaproteobacteria bacterium]|nr:transporter permease [Deltaproteobacteria bacterium]MBS1245035.1 transporter permease [Deltaproteobacteria bacterium]
MNIRTLAWKNLLRRKSRAVFTGLGIFLGIATFVAISSITSQMEGAVQDQLDRFGANIVVSPRTEQVSLGFGDIALGGTEVAHSRLTMADRERITSIHHKDRIRSVVPFLMTGVDASGKNIVWMGLPAADVAGARPWWKIRGGTELKRGEVLLGAEAAALLDKGAGGTVTAGSRSYRVAGVLQPTGEKEDGMVIADIADVQSLAKKPGAVTYFEVAALCKECPVEDIVAQIGQVLPGARVSAIRQVVESRKAAVDHLRRLGFGVSAIVLLIGGLMVLVTVMGGVQERTREIGVLRAVGFRKRSIFSLLFWETGWVSLFSSLLGAGTGIAAAYLASPAFGIEHSTIVLPPAIFGAVAGLTLGLLGAIPPARRAAALSPTEAIRSL